MSKVYTLNPTSAPDAARNLASMLSTMTDDEVILQVSQLGCATKLTKSNVSVNPMGIRKVYNTDGNSSSSSFGTENPAQSVCVQALRGNTDTDFVFTPCYMAFEVPHSDSASASAPATDTAKISVNCFPTKDDVMKYISARGLRPIYNGDISSWRGIEKAASNGYTTSTMVFTASDRFMHMKRLDAISYCRLNAAGDDEEPVVIKTSKIQLSTVYIVPCEPCDFNIIRSSKYQTSPVFKTRLLMFYDYMKHYIDTNLKRWIDIKHRRAESHESGEASFKYKIEHASYNIPIMKMSNTVIAKELPIASTLLWKPFYDAHTIEEKLNAALGLLNKYGIVMSLDEFLGPIEDYVKPEERRNYIPPTRVQVIIASDESQQSQGRCQHRTSSRSRSRSRPDRVGQGWSEHDNHTHDNVKTGSLFGNVVQQAMNPGRGPGRGRGSNNDSGRGRGNGRGDQGRGGPGGRGDGRGTDGNQERGGRGQWRGDQGRGGTDGNQERGGRGQWRNRW